MFRQILRRWSPPAVQQKALTLDQALERLVASGGTAGSGVIVNELTALRVSAVIACLTRVGEDVATTSLTIRRRATGLPEAQNHPLERVLLRRPNHWQTPVEFRQMMTAQAMLRGDAVAIMQKAAGRVHELWPVARSEVLIDYSGTWPRYTVNAYDGALSGTYSRDEVLHLRGFGIDGRSGLDRLSTGREVIGLASAAEGTMSKSFANGGRMPGYWSTDNTLSAEAADKLADMLRKATTGQNQFRSPVLDAGLKYHKTGQNFDEADIVEARKHQVIEVCAHFGVLPAVLGIDDKTQGFASFEAMMRAHVSRTLRPWLVRWEHALNAAMFDHGDEYFVAHDTRELEKATTLDRAQALASNVMNGIMTRNEARRVEGLPPLAGLDEPLTPLNMQETPAP